MVLLGHVEEQDALRLRAVLSNGRPHGLAAVQLADAPMHEAMKLHVQADGHATLAPPHGATTTPIRLFHLKADAADILLQLVPEPAQSESPAGTGAEQQEPAENAPDIRESGPSASAVAPENTETIDVANSERQAERLQDPGAETLQNENSSPMEKAGGNRGSVPGGERTRPVRIRLLGPLTVTVHGKTVTRGLVGYAGELLAYLAVHPHPVTKEAILEAIWPERTPQAATQAFNTAKTSVRTALRQALAATTSVNGILTTGDLSHINYELIGTDLADFDDAVRATASATDAVDRLAAHRRVADLYTGELCAGASYDWAEPAREDLRRRALDALGALASAAAPEDPERAMTYLDQAIGIDRYNEQLYIRLAQLQAAHGRLDAVRLTTERLTSSLGELGEKPCPPTSRALQELLHPTSTPKYGTRPAPPVRRPVMTPVTRGARP